MKTSVNDEMTKTNLKRLILLIAIFTTLIPQTVHADSSWIWLTRYRPWDVLPPVALATIVIEVLAIWLIPHSDNFLKTALTVIIANVVSFMVPYLVILKIGFGTYSTIDEFMDSYPIYIVGIGYCISTLVFEMPIIYALLCEQVKSRKKLHWTIVVANITTTAMVAVIERMITHGEWGA